MHNNDSKFLEVLRTFSLNTLQLLRWVSCYGRQVTNKLKRQAKPYSELHVPEKAQIVNVQPTWESSIRRALSKKLVDVCHASPKRRSVLSRDIIHSVTQKT